jgi:long-chain acyl-CoA synthetase
VSVLVSRFAEIRRAAPNRPLIHRPTGVLTAADIGEAGDRIADALHRSGVERGHLVLSEIGNRAESVGLVLACRLLGAALMQVEAGTPSAEIQQLAERFGARIHVSFAHDRVDAMPTAAAVATASLPYEPRAYPDAAVLKLTSGSTGLPKAIYTTESQIVTDALQIASTMGVRADDVQLAVIPLSHSYGLNCLLTPLLLQGTAMVLRDSFVPQQLPADASRSGATRLAGVPFMFDYFIAHPPEGGWPVRLTRVISAGARLAPETAMAFHRAFGVKIHGFYGTSETGGICFDPSDEIEVGDSVGLPLHGVTLSFLQNEDLPAGSGRVCVHSPAVASGYVGSERGDFTDDGFLTGDFGHLDAQGQLVLQGRISSFINVAGRKVHPDEVERVLRQMPGIGDVRVLAADDPRRGQQVVACVVPAAGAAAPLAQDVRQFCAARLAPHKIPRTVITLDSIPLTARGKTDRAAIEERVRTALAGSR